jgi:hypothetical protein
MPVRMASPACRGPRGPSLDAAIKAPACAGTTSGACGGGEGRIAAGSRRPDAHRPGTHHFRRPRAGGDPWTFACPVGQGAGARRACPEGRALQAADGDGAQDDAHLRRWADGALPEAVWWGFARDGPRRSRRNAGLLQVRSHARDGLWRGVPFPVAPPRALPREYQGLAGAGLSPARGLPATRVARIMPPSHGPAPQRMAG